jgi:hypothetical protein
MSHGVVVFSLDFERVERLWSCRTPVVVDRILQRVGHTPEDEDEVEPEEFAEGETRPPTIREALQHFVMGEPPRAEFPRPYALALLAMCHYAGDLLLVNVLYGTDWPHVEAIDKTLARYGYREPIRLSNVLSRGIPILDLPVPDESPTVGYLTPQEVAASPFMGQMWSGPKEICDSMYEFAGWVAAAAGKGHGLVGFYY